MKSRTELVVPLNLHNVIIDPSSSPAHVGKLRYSVDFICPEGTPVYAAASGRVDFVKGDSTVGGPDIKYWNDGNRVDVHHGSEYTAYEHLSTIVVANGQMVEAGQLIGYSGATGYLAHLGPHLHFECYEWHGPGEEDYETIEPFFRMIS